MNDQSRMKQCSEGHYMTNESMKSQKAEQETLWREETGQALTILESCETRSRAYQLWDVVSVNVKAKYEKSGLILDKIESRTFGGERAIFQSRIRGPPWTLSRKVINSIKALATTRRPTMAQEEWVDGVLWAMRQFRKWQSCPWTLE